MNKMIVAGILIPFGLFFAQSFQNNSGENQNSFTVFQQQKLPGETIYKKYCISCHQPDGGGVPNMAPPLQQTSYVLGEKETLIKIVLNGLKNVDINDETYNNPMPALGAVLKDKEIADVLTYVRNSFGNKAPAVTPDDVKKARANAKSKSE
ncbi:MAG: c-type cytochrome [Ginsengibacter sp.]